MRKANLVTILTAGVAVVVAAGAHGSTIAERTTGPGHAQAKSSPAPTAVDACTLLTKEEAASAVGEALDQAKSSGPFPVPMGGIETAVTGCAYESPKSVHGIKLTVHRVPPDKAARFKQFYQGVCARKECVSGVDADVAADAENAPTPIIFLGGRKKNGRATCNNSVDGVGGG